MRIKLGSTSVLVAVAVILSAILVSRELWWRFDPALDIHNTAAITDSHGNEHILHIRQRSDSPVDTVRREFEDIRHGKTEAMLWLEGSQDTLRASINGRYYSEIRGFRIAADSSSQIFLVPNTEHGLPTGWGELVFIKPNGKLSSLHLMAMNVGDVDEDRWLEMYDPERNVFTRLDPSTGSWVPVSVKAKRPVK